MRCDLQASPTIAPWLAGLKVRLLVEADLPALEWGGEFTHFRRLYQEIYRAMLQGRVLMWVAERRSDPPVQEEIIGQVFVQLNSSRADMADGARRAYIYSFRVKPEYRGYGVGACMLQTTERDLIQRGYLWATLNVAQDNPAGLRFYERYGYRMIGDDPGRWTYIDHQGSRREVIEPAFRMEKRLG
ncbi:MAG: GNAT family N-acetyltransferase [Anaerolineales bacterium]|nr:GNAT family N-acetyltransferase [Anaerolineales bacterium]